MSVRAELVITDPGACPIASASTHSSEAITEVARTSTVSQSGEVTEEFIADDHIDSDSAEFESVFTYGSKSRYRFNRESGWGCVCEVVERHGCPVADIYAEDGTLGVVFFGSDIAVVKRVLRELNAVFDGISLRQLTGNGTGDDADFVFVDRNALTSRQLEVVETSYELGYFEHPKQANAGDVAEALDIAPSTFAEHLAAAQRKLLKSIVSP